ncbi:Uncharacterised protein [Streptococcus pneumoniae]|nr:Uncharacterised protein [Streptococcus pneumoniae]
MGIPYKSYTSTRAARRSSATSCSRWWSHGICSRLSCRIYLILSCLLLFSRQLVVCFDVIFLSRSFRINVIFSFLFNACVLWLIQLIKTVVLSSCELSCRCRLVNISLSFISCVLHCFLSLSTLIVRQILILVNGIVGILNLGINFCLG